MVKLNCIYPERFFEEEERCDYTVSSNMKKIWAVELDLLNAFTQVCNKYNIPFYATGGTLLGAVRHKGMIPWDDDIDVMMFRKDYDRLCEIGPKEFKHPYFFQTEQTDKGSLRGHIQIRNNETTGILKREFNTGRTFNQGIFLDVFPLDNVPDNVDERKKYLKTANELKKRYKRKVFLSIYYNFRLRKNVFILVRDFLLHLLYKIYPSCSYFDYEKAYHEFEVFSQAYNNIETESVIIVPFYEDNCIRKRAWFRNILFLPFEFMSLPVPSGYDELLKKLYGDYNKFVKGTSIHGDVIFDTEKSYKEYLKQ